MNPELPQRAMGVDPGLRATGWGVVERTPTGLRMVAFGTVRPKVDAPYPERLAAVHQPLLKWLDAYERWQAAYTGVQVITTSVADGVAKTERSMQRAGR